MRILLEKDVVPQTQTRPASAEKDATDPVFTIKGDHTVSPVSSGTTNNGNSQHKTFPVTNNITIQITSDSLGLVKREI